MTRTSVRLLACSVTLLLTACWGFSAGVEEPDLTDEFARIEYQIHVGQTTRQEVRRLLGTPIFEDSSWGIELYRSDQTDVSTEWMVVMMLPVPGWTEVREYRLYPLILYSSSDVVEGIGAGEFAERHQDNFIKEPVGTNAEVLGFTLAIYPCDEPWCLWLVAPADRSVPLLRAPPAPGRCVLNIARPAGAVEIALDKKTLLRSFGRRRLLDYPEPEQPWFARITVSPGAHTIRATPGRALVRTIDCRGDQWFVVRIAQEIQVLDSPDAIPDDARLVLFHNDRPLTAAH